MHALVVVLAVVQLLGIATAAWATTELLHARRELRALRQLLAPGQFWHYRRRS
jgi:hypothetical protein